MKKSFSFMSQLEYKSENQNFTSNFTFQFIKKIQKTNKTKNKQTKWHFEYTDFEALKL